MYLEFGIILAFFTTLVALFIFFVIEKSSSKKQFQKLTTLKEENLLLKSKVEEYHEGYVAHEHDTETGFVKGQIDKVEAMKEELLRQKQRVEEAKSLVRDSGMVQYNFFSNVSHEIRTPLNSILTFAELLEQEISDNKQKKYVTNILESGNKLLTLMDDVIELAQLETKEFQTKTKAVDTKELFEVVFRENRPLAKKKSLEFSLEIDEELPDSLILDDVKVQAILRNLIDNAIRYTKSGSVKLKVLVDALDKQKNSVDLQIIVQDTGRGIEAENINSIFKIFEKHQTSETIQLQGSGLELSINKKIAKLLNGDITVTSKFGEGSTFVFEMKDVEIVLLSADEEVNDEEIDFSLLAANEASVMVIDEDLESRETIKQSFESAQIECYTFETPKEALELLKEKDMDLIFIDIDVLSVDENAVSKVLARMSKASVISLTTTSIKNISFSSDGAEIRGHLKKPLSKAALFQISLKEFNNEHARNIEKNTSSAEDDIFISFDQEKLTDFISTSLPKIRPMFEKAYSTKDLNSITLFAKALLKLALWKKITPFVSFSNRLLEEIQLFNIEAINSMLKEYESRT